MKKFIKRRFFKRKQRETGCGKCAGCQYRSLCKKQIETGKKPCRICYFYDVCDAELKSGVERR